MTEEQPSFAKRVDLLIEQWNCLIDELKHAAKFASPGRSKKYDEALTELIAFRESTRRGLYDLSGLSETTGGTGPAAQHGESKGKAEPKILSDDLLSPVDAVKGPRITYGPGE
jgi:hypothetical protein